MSDGSLLIVEDEEAQRTLLETFLTEEGFKVRAADTLESALGALNDAVPAALLTDYNLPDGTGLDVLRHARGLDADLPVILITAYGTVPVAVEAMREGAVDVLLKPVEPDALLRTLRRSLRLRSLEVENVRLRARLEDRFVTEEERIIAHSPAMKDLLGKARRVAPTLSTVLITGESGTGKELVAHLLHEQGLAPREPFVATHCAALPETLLESELFGHSRGAFTGAVADRVGRFEEAAGGTLFLDEIGEIPASLQVKLLRVLQEREIVRLGENKVRPVQARLVAATNRDLEEEVREGRFREDLFYRINVIRLHVPPLRERPEDLVDLVSVLSREAALRNSLPALPFDDDALEALAGRPFPGNVRELRNTVERALLLAPGPRVGAEDIGASGGPGRAGADVGPEGLEEAVTALEVRLIRQSLAASGGVQTRAARLLGIAERVLRYKMRKYGIRRRDT